MAGLLRFSHSKSEDCLNFLDKKDPRFRDLRGACDNVSTKLMEEGVGVDVKYAAIFYSWGGGEAVEH